MNNEKQKPVNSRLLFFETSVHAKLFHSSKRIGRNFCPSITQCHEKNLSAHFILWFYFFIRTKKENFNGSNRDRLSSTFQSEVPPCWAISRREKRCCNRIVQKQKHVLLWCNRWRRLENNRRRQQLEKHQR